MGRFLFWLGVFLIATGLVLHYKIHVPFLTNWLGKLPGDIIIKKENITIYLPLASSILISLVLSFFLWLIFKTKAE